MEEEEMNAPPQTPSAAYGFRRRIADRIFWIRLSWKEILARILIRIAATGIFFYATYRLLGTYPEITYLGFLAWLTVLVLWALALLA